MENKNLEICEKKNEEEYIKEILKIHPFVICNDVNQIKSRIILLEDKIKILEEMIKNLKQKNYII